MTLEELEALTAKATPAPWHYKAEPKGHLPDLYYHDDGLDYRLIGEYGFQEENDGLLIAAMRNKIKMLIAVAKAAQDLAQNKFVRCETDHLGTCYICNLRQKLKELDVT